MLLLLIIGLTAPAHPQQPGATPLLPAGAEPDRIGPALLPQAQAVLKYLIVIENRSGSIVRAVDPPAAYAINRPGVPLGTVTRTCRRTAVVTFERQSATHPRVTGSALDGIGLQLFAEPDGSCGEIMVKPAADALAPGGPDEAAICLDIAAGHGIFGGSHPLIVGNPLAVYRGGTYLQLESAAPDLRVGDTLVIGVFAPEVWPRALSIENAEGGLVTVTLDSGASLPCGYVRRTLAGPVAADEVPPGPVGALLAAAEDSVELRCCAPEPAGLLRLMPAARLADETAAGTLLAEMYSGTGWGEAPLFSGFLYPVGGREPALSLPALTVEVKAGGGWLPLGGIVVPDALSELTALRFKWAPLPDADQPPPESAGLEQLDPVLVPPEMPSFRE